MPTFQTSPGMRDILPPQSARFRRFVDVFAEVVEAAGYRQLVTPLIEDAGVFNRLGEAGEGVSKEMYEFEDRGGRRVALRPEFTAGICRAYAQHRPTPPWKVWSAGPNFRYERPQRGRYRQFEQVDIEVLGVDDPSVDVEVIALGWEFFRRLGLRRVRLALNSLGEPADRARYVQALSAHFEASADELADETRNTLGNNALRVLDSKRSQDQALIASAPRIADFYSESAAAHFDAVRQGLDRLAIPYEVEPKLVRGLDYYGRTTFEYQAESLDSAQNAIGGGGRYDGLVEAVGGPEATGIGLALGIDRSLIACDDEGVFPAEPLELVAFVVDVTGGLEAVEMTSDLRAAGLACDRAFDNRSMKAQMKLANRSGAAYAVIVGEDELTADAVVVKPMRGDGEQVNIPRTDLISHLVNQLKATS